MREEVWVWASELFLSFMIWVVFPFHEEELRTETISLNQSFFLNLAFSFLSDLDSSTGKIWIPLLRCARLLSSLSFIIIPQLGFASFSPLILFASHLSRSNIFLPWSFFPYWYSIEISLMHWPKLIPRIPYTPDAKSRNLLCCSPKRLR